MEKDIGKTAEWFVSKVGNQHVQVVSCDQKIQKLRNDLFCTFYPLAEAVEMRDVEDDTVESWLREFKNAVFDAEDVLDRYDTLSKLKLASYNSDGDNSIRKEEQEMEAFAAYTRANSDEDSRKSKGKQKIDIPPELQITSANSDEDNRKWKGKQKMDSAAAAALTELQITCANSDKDNRKLKGKQKMDSAAAAAADDIDILTELQITCVNSDEDNRKWKGKQTMDSAAALTELQITCANSDEDNRKFKGKQKVDLTADTNFDIGKTFEADSANAGTDIITKLDITSTNSDEGNSTNVKLDPITCANSDEDNRKPKGKLRMDLPTAGIDSLTKLDIASAVSDEDKAKLKQKMDLDVAGIQLRYDFSSEIDSITQCLWQYEFGGPMGLGRRMLVFTPSFSTNPGDNIVGRKEETQRIISLLISDNVEPGCLPVVTICGDPGIGKTVVAKLAFNDVQLQNYFDRRIWVYVPDGSSVESITKKTVEAATKRRQDVVSLNLLLNKLTGLLTGRKFLLVLDNLCLEENFYWKILQLPLLAGAPGSKVLITIRNNVVCRGMTASEPINLAGLGNDDGLKLLQQLALPKMRWDDFLKKFKEIGKHIVERCQGSPLVVKSLGVVLRNNTNESEWNILLGQMGPLRDNRGDLLICLMISYRSLDYPLKKCFAYCSVLPSGYEFCKDDLIRMWIAEGLVRPSGTVRPEAIGGEYFDQLFWRLYFENCGRDQEKYRMPGLMHDLARLVSEHETLLFIDNSVLGDGSNASKQGYRFGCIVQRKEEPLDLNKIYSFQRLRTIFTYNGDSRLHLNKLPSAIFDELKFLRVLNLGNSSLQELPESIGNLIQLRYLGLSSTDIKVLPEEVCNLYNLQTINLRECEKLVQLPVGTSKLVNLRHIVLDLQWDNIIDLQSMPLGIGSIPSLETLSRFTVTRDKAGECNIHELNNLQLRGELCISKIEHLSIANVVKLKEKKYIDKLMLRWTEDVSKSSTKWRTYSVEVANKLTPHYRLKTLWFKDYPGTTFPLWVGNGSCKMLEELRLSGCINCEVFPHLQMLPRLKKLHAQRMDSLISLQTPVYTHFPALEILAISDMPKLEKWFEAEAGTFPKLQTLEIINCPNLRMNCAKLKELKHFPSQLEIEIQSLAASFTMSTFFPNPLTILAGSTTDATAGKSIEWLISQISDQFNLLSSCEKSINKLRRTLKHIQCVLLDTEECRLIEDDAVKNWIFELRIATLDADDVLDRYDTLCSLRNKVKAFESRSPHHRQLGNHSDDGSTDSVKWPKVSSISYPYLFLKSVFTQLDRNKHFNEDIEKIEKKLDEIAEGRKQYRLGAEDGSRRGNIQRVTHTGRPTVEGYVIGSVVGRDKEKMVVVGQLLSEEVGMQHHPSVIPIWGVAGIGKTTLAQLAFDDVAVKNNFDLCVWVSVPEECDVVRITKEIIEAIRRRRADSVSFNVLQEHLRRLLHKKKFLLVLDNLGVTDYSFWDYLQLSLCEGLEGSKVLVTCRSKVVFRGMPVVCDPINLKGLDETDCWELLRQKAFPRKDWDDYLELEKIGRDIVKMCGGSPLAAKSLGSVLYEQTDEDFWTSLQEEMLALKEKVDAVHVSLMISYHHLSYDLKHCFVYCSVFPDGYTFDKDELVRLWIAEGLVSASGSRRLETIGGKYFDNLCWKSFFEVANKDEQKYKIPSQMHDLARLLSKSESLIFENNELKVDSKCPEDLRHASIIHCELKLLDLWKLYGYKNLRTVVIFGGGTRVSLWTVPLDLGDNLRCMRVLKLNNTAVEKLPDSVGDLLHLRYLGLSKTKIKELPETVCNLYNLQTIDLSECYDFQHLPKYTSNLVNLRHIVLNLDWNKITVMKSMPPRIGSVTSLETLSRFTVTKVDGNGSNIGELKALKLRKELCLSKLEDVDNAKDAEEVNLAEKQYIDKLLLQWSEYMIHHPSRRLSCEEVAKALCPQPRLKVLCFKDYPESKFPDWLGDEKFKFLETLTLSGCKNCVVFPTLGKLPQLKNLHVEHMDNLVSMGEALKFPALETLTVVDMPNLENWFKAEADLFPKLQKLELVNCPKLVELKHLPPTLMPIIINCNSLVYPPVPSAQVVVFDSQTDLIIG